MRWALPTVLSGIPEAEGLAVECRPIADPRVLAGHLSRPADIAEQTIRTRQTRPMTPGTFRSAGQRCSPVSSSWRASGISKSRSSPVISAPTVPLSPLAAAAPRSSGAWEPSPDSLEWQHDFDLPYIKIR